MFYKDLYVIYIKAYDKLLGEKRRITVEYTVLTNRRPCQSLNNAKGYGIMELFGGAYLGIFFLLSESSNFSVQD